MSTPILAKGSSPPLAASELLRSSIAPPRPPLLLRARILQIRATAALLNLLGRSNSFRRALARLRSVPGVNNLLRHFVGFHRTCASFAEAQAVASRFISAGHEHPDEIAFHASMADTLRESDYPVLFHLAPIAAQLRHVFDLGGSVGNLFYSYRSHLPLSPSMIWFVYDLPFIRPIGERFARDRGEKRIRFADSPAQASGADLLLISGSLHYFEQPLDAFLRSLHRLPPHVIVNRSPFSAGSDLITIQDNHSFLAPCKLHSRPALLAGMQALGYQLRAEWPVHERKLLLPLDPELSARTYSGFYFTLKLLR